MTTLVIGGSGGIGSEVIKLLAPETVDWSYHPFNTSAGVDVTDRLSIRDGCEALWAETLKVDQLVHCAGINALYPFDSLSNDVMLDTMELNAFSIVYVVQELRHRHLLPDGARICSVVSNAAHVPMSHSLAYNASKAAQEMIVRQMARELREYSIFGVNPNRIAGTRMSTQITKRVCELRGWTPEEAMKYQLAALPCGRETPPASLAAFIVDLLRPIHHPYITGNIFPYGGPQ